VIVAWFDPTPTVVSIVLFTAGWSCGWLMLCRPRRLPPCGSGPRPAIAVVVPARNEASSIGRLVAAVVPQLRDGDAFVVVDDHSTDETAAIARGGSATVLSAPALPDGWAGKPHACHVGATTTTQPVLVFLDADVLPAPDLLDRLAAAVDAEPERLVSVQPWHATVRPYEWLSMIFNITALMGCAAFTAFGRRVRTRVAFGPVIACRRTTYDAVGGHGNADVRRAILEDIALARAVGRSSLYLGRRHETTFRMYPDGVRPLVQGWTKGMGIGADATPWWALVATAGWITSLAGGSITSPWFALASILQLMVLARLAGRFSPVAVVLYPVAVAMFVVLFVRSAAVRLTGGTVRWKERELRPDQSTD
jgi:4,4'-diaponeurosporenoate glycosyltransferase